jgi:hypothetical protein
MRNWMIGIVVGILSASLGVGAAYGAKSLLQQYAPAIRSTIQTARGTLPQAQGNRFQNPGERQFGPMMGRTGRVGGFADSITSDEAVQMAETMAARLNANLKPAKVLEFENAFDVIFVEADTGRGAVQYIVPKSGRGIQMAPDLRWNLKYGPASENQPGSAASDNSVTLADAGAAAKTWLAKVSPNATVQDSGLAFYGYYLFEYVIDGKTAGIVLVNGLNGQAAGLKELGAFVSEKEISQ